MQEKKSGRGGKRAGAGRKLPATKKNITVKIKEKLIEPAKEKAMELERQRLGRAPKRANLSSYVEGLIETDLHNEI